MTQSVGNPFPYYTDMRGRPLTGGSIYIGETGEDPETNPVNVYYDAGLVHLASQPIKTIGGFATRDGSPTLLFTAEETYSLQVNDADGATVFYVANAVEAFNQFQPLDSDLTAIAALTTTAFGRGLLTQASAAAMRSYAGVVDALPLTGGTMTGNIGRDGAGGHAYAASGVYPRLRIFVTANGDPDPRTDVGDVWLEQEA